MSTSELARTGRHRSRGHVLPDPPGDAEKYSYAWRSLPFLATALLISAVCLIITQAWFEIRNAPILPYLVVVFALTCDTFLGSRLPQIAELRVLLIW
jgi:hypothetical protein